MRIKTIHILPELTAKFEANHTKGKGCWLWTGAVTGYARDRGSLAMNINGVRYSYGAPRYSYSLYVGTIPEGLEMDHLCKVPICVNPEHLEAVTPYENKSREAARQTHCKRGHIRTPENLIYGVKCNSCKPCMKAFARAKKLGITTDEAVHRESELDKLFARPTPKPKVSSLAYKVDWNNDPHCRDCGHKMYAKTIDRKHREKAHAGQGRCWVCKRKHDLDNTPARK